MAEASAAWGPPSEPRPRAARIGSAAATPIDVLVVDDNVGFLRVIAAVLGEGEPQFVVHPVETGEDAVAFVVREGRFAEAPRPAFMVLDFRLPDMDAPEVLTRLAEDAACRELPVLVLSQMDWVQDKARSLAAGARAFRVKPSDLDELRALVVEFWRDVAV